MDRRAKITVALGTRPEAVKLAPVIHRLRAEGFCDVRVLATAQHREMLDQVLAFFGIAADADLDLMRPGQSLGDLTSRMVKELSAYFADDAPDYVLVQGDTTTVFATALCCFYAGIPVGHVEAGLRTRRRDAPFPEEMNRQMTSRLADLHFAPTETAAQHLREEAIDPESILVTGNTVIDALLWSAARVDSARFVPRGNKRMILVTAHRRESFGEPFERICAALRKLADRGDVEVVYPVHPNPNVQGPAQRMLGGHPAIRLERPLDYPDFVAAMKACHLILTDSGGVQEEAPSLGKPVLVLRETTERPEGIAGGTSILVGTDTEKILAQASKLLDDAAAHAAMARRSNPFGDGKASERIAAALRARLVG